MASISKKYGIKPLNYNDGLVIAKMIKSRLIANGAKIGATIVGSLRRKAEYTRDIDLLICTTAKVKTFTIGKCGCISTSCDCCIKVIEQYADGDCKKSFIINVKVAGKSLNVKVDIFFALPKNKAFALMHHTGGKIFNIKMRMHAKRLGLKLNQYGIFNGKKRAYGTSKIKSEKEIFKYFEMPYCSPAERKMYDK